MDIKPFKLERYFALHEFSAPFLMSCSDCEALTTEEVLGMADEKMQAMWKDLKLSYTDSKGHPMLRQEIAGLYETVGEEEILVTVPEEGIYIAMRTLLEAGDHVIVSYPAYQSLYEIAGTIGCQISYWKPEAGERWSFDIRELKKLIQDKTKLIVINFPHNPTGATLSKDEIEAIVSMAKEVGAYVFSDEMYRLLEYEEGYRLPAIADLYVKGISLSGMSKTFALPGLRVGWLATRDREVMKKFQVYKDYTTICGSGPSEILAIIALRAKDLIIKRNLGIIENNLRTIEGFLEKHKKLFSWQPPIAGPIGFGKYLGDEGVDSLCQQLIDEKGIMLLGAHHFDYQGNYFRLGFARKNLPEILDVLDQWLEEKKK